MSILVQKFGGTSLGTAQRINRVSDIILNHGKDSQIIAVVSAISNSHKSQGTTSLLFKVADEALKNGSYNEFIDSIESVHLKIIEDLKLSKKQSKLVVDSVKKELKWLKSFISAINVIKELSARSNDAVLAVGEKLSATILAGVLNSKGVPAEVVNLEKAIDVDFEGVNREFHEYARQKISQLVTNILPKVPVVTGYIGRIPGGILDGIGRGYTDFTAATVAASINAKEMQIWKEVDGVYSADPNKVKDAYVIDTLSPVEAAEITYYGSEVIHPFTIEQVIQTKIPVRVKNVLKPNQSGTVIDSELSVKSNQQKPSAVTIKRNIQVINIKSNRMLMAHGFMALVFNLLKKHQIVIDLISTSEVSISLTVDSKYNLTEVLKSLKEIGEVSLEQDMAILSIVGHGLRKTVGTAGRMFQTLANDGINIEMISQGASEINISCVLKDEDATKAMRAIHEEML